MARRKRKAKRDDGRTARDARGKPDEKAGRPTRGAGPGPGAGAPGKEKPEKSATRNLIETIVIVVVLVLVLRTFLIEAFKIPTGSMEPALIGNPYYGDRVLAWKPSTWLFSPSRWSVFVFVKHPERGSSETGDLNYIKRVVGLPGEHVLIAGGDIFIGEEGREECPIARKPAGVQEEVWHLLYDGAREVPGSGRPPRWELDPGLECAEDRGLVSRRSEGRTWARFAFNHYDDDRGKVTNLFLRAARLTVRCPRCGKLFQADFATDRTRVRCPAPKCGCWLDILRDELVVDDAGRFECPYSDCKRYLGNRRKELADGHCPYCKKDLQEGQLAQVMGVPGLYPSSREEEEAVADLRVSLDVRAAEARGLALVEIALDDDRYTAEIPLGGGRARVVGPAWPEGVASKGLVAAFDPGAARRIAFAHVDQSVVLTVAGKTVVEQTYDAAWTARAGKPASNSIRIGLEDVEATLDGIRIERDLHYLARGRAGIMEFYSLGSKKWREEPGRRRPYGNPFDGEGEAVRTRRRLGEAEFLMFGDNSPSSHDSRMWGPVQERDLIGRAFFLFWPPNRMRWLR